MVTTAFADDPIAPHSAAFPLSRASGPDDSGPPSVPELRPWGLRGMSPARQQGHLRDRYHYDHGLQVAVNGVGRPLVMEDPSAASTSSNDGDEGPSEDWSHDYCPDQPFQV